MRAEFDKDGVLNIIPENNAETMAIKYFTNNDGKVLYHATQFDYGGEPVMEVKPPADFDRDGDFVVS